ncbi:phosphoribosyltransferase [Pendulispora albinea]|uniref:Phosphoribosyltransferase n=1 Tax=Pendulispora albinea TaxID=2741071 RepID=A0ABZ2MC05_9BACT
MAARFLDRRDAGRRLSAKLTHHAGTDAIVLALPRGGVPVGYEVARALNLDLDVFIVRKLGVPGHQELAMGAVASGGVRVTNPTVIRALGIPDAIVERIAEYETNEIARREQRYRAGRPPVSTEGRPVIVVDDGLATGASMYAAISAIRARGTSRISIAVPLASPEICADMRSRADEVVCLWTPVALYAVGLWYEDFTQTTDEEVCELLGVDRATRERRAGAPARGRRPWAR